MIRRSALASAVAFGLILAASVLPARAAVPNPADDPTHVALSTLHPRTSAAVGDLARVYSDRCHVAHDVTTPTHCTYGDRDGTIRVIVIGDSIAAQWWAAIDGAARRGGWRITWMTKTACPAADVTIRSQGVRYTACDTWRRNVLTKIRGFARADLVVMAGSSSSTLINRSDGAVITDPTAAAAEWATGYRRTLNRLDGVAERAVILRDTPSFATSIPSCVAAHSGWTSPCSRARSAAFSVTRWNAEMAVDAAYSWVRATDLGDWLCQLTRCWPVTSTHVLRYRDGHHLTNTFAIAMVPAMYSRLRWLMR